MTLVKETRNNTNDVKMAGYGITLDTRH